MSTRIQMLTLVVWHYNFTVKWIVYISQFYMEYFCSVSEMQVFEKFIWSEPEEVTINLPCGPIAGKWWGPKYIRPILCLHGWQDNAGSFDAIIPLLPKHVSYLAIDLPGHGLSYRYPAGIVYNFPDMTFLIKLIVDLYKWKKVSLFAHSMAVMATYTYAALFPDEVDFLIAIDSLKPPYKDPDELLDLMTRDLENYVKFEKSVQSGEEPPIYSYDEIIDRVVIGSAGSVNKEAAKYLLKRGAEQSKTDPNKYYFTRDVRVKLGVNRMAHRDYCLLLARRMTVPYVYIKGKDSPYFEPVEFHDETVDVLKRYNPNFEYHMVEGNHHLHLTHPQNISGIISKLIFKIRPINSESKKNNRNFNIHCKL